MLDRRLGWDGLDRDQSRHWLDDASQLDQPPDWAATLQTILDASRTYTLLADLPLEQRRIPFIDLLTPLAALAVEKLELTLPWRRAVLSDAGLDSASLYLKRLLSTISARTLWQAFKNFKDSRESRLDQLLPPPDGHFYNAFARSCAAGEFAAILDQYPVLARQLATAIDDWAAAMCELLQRLRQDAPELRRKFADGFKEQNQADLGQIVTLELGLSDRHHRGRTVTRLGFAGGLRLIYKPKCLEIDQAFFRLLEAINTISESRAFRLVEVLPKKGYGWMEEIRPRSCQRIDDVERFYHQTGRLMGLIYALEGYDCHAENVLADGDQPVPIDLETLMNPSNSGLLEDGGLSPATATASTQLYRSVMRTGFLPTWTLGADGRHIDISMLGASSDQRLLKTPSFEDPNSDRMALAEVIEAVRATPDQLVEAIGIGANLGFASILYSLSLTAELLGDSALQELAVDASTVITPEVIARDDKNDVVFGASGAILALLRIHRASGHSKPLEVAELCGRHLVEQLRATPHGGRSCPTMDRGFHTGFSHGAAGVATALLRLYRATDESRFRRAAQEINCFEESLFDQQTANYPDFRSHGEKPNFMTTWCHGAPGIALARLSRYDIERHTESLQQATRCLHTTVDNAIGDADHLCCGNSGRLDILLEGSRRLSAWGLDDQAADFAQRARQLGTWIDRRATSRGGYELPSGLTTGLNSPGFFTGLAGIGYSWLRLACTDLPSVLNFE